MFAFTIFGFIIEDGKYRDFQQEVMADSPVEAMEKVTQQERRAVVSTVLRNPTGWGDGF